jgi:carotenoid cleavage dioxygenase
VGQDAELKGARPIHPDGTRDLTASTGNTSVLHCDHGIFALVENSLPFAITPELETIGAYELRRQVEDADDRTSET